MISCPGSNADNLTSSASASLGNLQIFLSDINAIDVSNFSSSRFGGTYTNVRAEDLLTNSISNSYGSGSRTASVSTDNASAQVQYNLGDVTTTASGFIDSTNLAIQATATTSGEAYSYGNCDMNFYWVFTALSPVTITYSIPYSLFASDLIGIRGPPPDAWGYAVIELHFIKFSAGESISEWKDALFGHPLSSKSGTISYSMNFLQGQTGELWTRLQTTAISDQSPPTSTSVPEPGILILLGISMASIVGLKRWWKE